MSAVVKELGVAGQAREAVRKALSLFGDESAVRASDVAGRAYSIIDPRRAGGLVVGWAAVHGLTDLAREELRGRYELPEVGAWSDSQIDAFDGELQARYSVVRGGADWYVKLDCLSKAEVVATMQRVAKLRNAAQSHLDKLAAYFEAKWGS